jgi:hypothetical protein
MLEAIFGYWQPGREFPPQHDRVVRFIGQSNIEYNHCLESQVVSFWAGPVNTGYASSVLGRSVDEYS